MQALASHNSYRSTKFRCIANIINVAIYDNLNNNRILTILSHDPLPKVKNGGRGVAFGGGRGFEKGVGKKIVFNKIYEKNRVSTRRLVTPPSYT